MASYNKCFLLGNLTRDPAMKFLPSQTAVAEFGLAVNRKYKTAAGEDKEEVAFIDCTAFGRQAETIAQYCTKGKPIFVEGRIKFDSWDDKNGGGKRSKLTVVVENFQFLGRAMDGFGDAQDGAEPPPRKVDHRTAAEKQPAPPMFAGAGRGKPQREPAEQPFGDEKQFEDADIPFAWEGPRRFPV